MQLVIGVRNVNIRVVISVALQECSTFQEPACQATRKSRSATRACQEAVISFVSVHVPISLGGRIIPRSKELTDAGVHCGTDIIRIW
jgi:hypothetical protein